MPELRERDDRYVSHFKLGKYQGITEVHDLVLDLGEGHVLNMTTLSSVPRVFLLKGFLREGEAEHIKARAKPLMRRAGGASLPFMCDSSLDPSSAPSSSRMQVFNTTKTRLIKMRLKM